MRTDAGDVSGAVTLEDVIDHLIAHLPIEIEVNVGQIDAAGVQKSLQRQTETQRVHIGNAEQITDE